MRGYVISQFFDCENGFIGILARNKIFRLQFLAAAGHEVHAEVGQALIPGAGNSFLFRAVFRRVPGQWVKFSRGELGSEEFRRWLRRAAFLDTAFDPGLGSPMMLPVREQADAVAA